MNAFPLVPLSDLCAINIGRTPSRGNSRYWGSGAYWLSIADMNQGRYLVQTKEQITEAAAKEVMGDPVIPGTVVLSFKLSIGKVGIVSTPMYTNEAIAALPIRNPESLIPEYLYRALHYVNLLEETDDAVMGKTLNKAKLARVRIPVPPLAEQKRIAEVLDRVDGLIAKRQQAISLLDNLVQSMFLDMFGDPVVNSRSWPQRRIGEIGRVITGNTPPRSDPANYGNYIEWIKSDNIDLRSSVLTEAVESLSAKGAKLGRKAPAGSVLVTCIAGSPASIGNAAIANREVSFNQQINALTSHDMETEFLYCLLKSSKSLVQAKSTGGMKGLVSKSRFESIMLISPPRELQCEFSRLFRRLETLREMHKGHMESLEALFASLQHKAFHGEL